MSILHNVNKLSIRQIHKKFPMFSLSMVFHHATQASDNLTEKKKKRTGQPHKVTDHDEQELLCVLKKLRKTDGSLTSKKIQAEAGLTHHSNRTVQAILNKHGFRCNREEYNCRVETTMETFPVDMIDKIIDNYAKECMKS